MRKTHTMHARRIPVLRHPLCVTGCTLTIMLALTAQSLRLQGASSDSESVQIGITIASGSSSQASSSAGSSAAGSAASSVAGTTPSPEDGGGGEDGGRRGTTERSTWRIIRLLQEWQSGQAGHPAAPRETDCRTQRAYADVPRGEWYWEAVDHLLQKEFLTVPESCLFFPDRPASRAEVARLLVEGHGGIVSLPLFSNGFIDSIPADWHYGYLEEAARRGWILGDDNCYGRLGCTVRPDDTITRAEAAAVIIRSLNLQPLGLSGGFPDIPAFSWYYETVHTAADYCILRGDDRTRRMRPADRVSRAELAVMLDRALQDLRYGKDCGHAVSRKAEPARVQTEIQRTARAPDLCRRHDLMPGYYAAQLRITRPDAPLLRGEMLVMLTESAGGITGLPVTGPTFADIPPHHRLFGYAEEALRCGWIGIQDCIPGSSCVLDPWEPVAASEVMHTLRSTQAALSLPCDLSGYAAGEEHAPVTRGYFLSLLQALGRKDAQPCNNISESGSGQLVLPSAPEFHRAADDCRSPSRECVMDAMRSDMHTATQVLAATLLPWASAVLGRTPASEAMLWTTAAAAATLLIITLERGVWKRSRTSRKAKTLHLHDM